MDLKTLFKKGLDALGLDVRRARRSEAGSPSRPIGNIRLFLEDVAARGFRPQGILDIGANRGDWTRIAKAVFPQANVIMIEPLDEMREPLERLCAELAGIQYVKAGAGCQEGQHVQTVWDDLDASSFLPAPADERAQLGMQRVTKMVTVDGVLHARREFSPDLVKLDIQGFELEALKGANSTFGRAEMFIVETSLYEFMAGMPKAGEVISFMRDREYELYDITGYLRRPLDGALGQIDIAFARRGGLLRASNRWVAV